MDQSNGIEWPDRAPAADSVSRYRGPPDPEPRPSVVSDQSSHLAGRGHAAAGAARQEPALPRHRHRHHGAAEGLLRQGPVSADSNRKRAVLIDNPFSTDATNCVLVSGGFSSQVLKRILFDWRDGFVEALSNRCVGLFIATARTCFDSAPWTSLTRNTFGLIVHSMTNMFMFLSE